MSQYIVQGIFAVAGIIALLAAILDHLLFSEYATGYIKTKNRG